MTKIEATRQLANILTAQLRGANSALTQKKAGAEQKQNRNETPTASSSEKLAQEITRRINGIDKHDTQRKKKAFRIFLESIFIAEFGEHLSQDPAFFQMVTDVQNQMESNAQVAGLINEAMNYLFSES